MRRFGHPYSLKALLKASGPGQPPLIGADPALVHADHALRGPVAQAPARGADEKMLAVGQRLDLFGHHERSLALRLRAAPGELRKPERDHLLSVECEARAGH